MGVAITNDFSLKYFETLIFLYIITFFKRATDFIRNAHYFKF